MVLKKQMPQPACEPQPSIFERIVGGPGKFHLFFVKECLTLYGMSIEETGEEGKGARFEIHIPRKLCQVA
jgi:signal transduction histidine kinase